MFVQEVIGESMKNIFGATPVCHLIKFVTRQWIVNLALIFVQKFQIYLRT
jgi:hypothetical protein